MSERSTTQLKQPIIKFGFDDSSLKRVENVKILFKDKSSWDIKKGQDGTNYDRINIQKSCNELYIMFYINNNELKDEMFIPLHNITTLSVSHISKEISK